MMNAAGAYMGNKRIAVRSAREIGAGSRKGIGYGSSKGVGACSLKIAVIFLLVIVIIGFTGIHRTAAQTNEEMHRLTHAGLSYERVVVQPGDSLWQLAVNYNNLDPNSVIKEIMRFNQLKSVYLDVGQVIYIPVDK